jgi:coniferyl-aldehyde dehydrogenase
MGAYHGIEGFRRLSHAKGVYEQRSRLDISRVIHSRFNWVTDLVIRYLLA